MNKLTLSLFVAYFVASSLALPVSKNEQEASPSKPVTHIHMVEDNDDAVRMYYERYIMQRDDSLQHSANTGGRVNVEVDVGKTKRQAGDEPKKTQPPHSQPAEDEQESRNDDPQPDFAAILALAGGKPQPLTEGAGYTRKRRQTSEDAKKPQPPHGQPAAQEERQSDDAQPDFAAILALAGGKPQPLTEGAGYTRKRRDAMEEIPEEEPKAATEEVPAEEAPHASADSDVLKKIALAYMLQAGDKPKPHWTPGASYSG